MRKLTATIVAVFAALMMSASIGVFAAYNSAVDALLDQARQHLTEGDFERADLVAQRIVRIDPDDARGWGLMADIREAQGNTVEAQQYRSRQRLARRQLNDSEDAHTSRSGTRAEGYTFNDLKTEDRERSDVPASTHGPASVTANENPRPPVDGWVQSQQMRPDSHAVVDEEAALPADVTTDTAKNASGELPVSDQAAASKRDRIAAVFASSGAYERQQRRDSARPDAGAGDNSYGRTTAPTDSRRNEPTYKDPGQAVSQHQYNSRERSQLERMRQQHRRQVARLHRKLFGRDSARRQAQHGVSNRVEGGANGQLPSTRGRIGSNDHNRSTASLVPAGYYPPSGLCRIWYYDLAPDQQPPAGDCRRLRSQLPVGARLLKGA